MLNPDAIAADVRRRLAGRVSLVLVRITDHGNVVGVFCQQGQRRQAWGLPAWAPSRHRHRRRVDALVGAVLRWRA